MVSILFSSLVLSSLPYTGYMVMICFVLPSFFLLSFLLPPKNRRCTASRLPPPALNILFFAPVVKVKRRRSTHGPVYVRTCSTVSLSSFFCITIIESYFIFSLPPSSLFIFAVYLSLYVLLRSAVQWNAATHSHTRTHRLCFIAMQSRYCSSVRLFVRQCPYVVCVNKY